MISQGSLKGKAQAADLAAEFDKVYDLVVRVDLRAQKVTFTAGGATVEAKLAKPMARISHVGYSMDSALVDFSNLEVASE